MLELIIVIAYFIAIVAIGIISRRKRWGLDDFFVSGRRCSTLFITGSLLATIIGGSATVGMAGLGFTQGLTGSWWLLVGCVGLFFLGLFFAKKVREFGLYTLPQMLGKQYDGRVALASSVLIVIAWMGVVAGQIIAAGKILSVMGFGSAEMWMVLFAIIFIFYVIVGGQDAVIRTDVLQIAIIYIGIFAGFGILVAHLGGLSALTRFLPADRFAFPLSSRFGFPELLTYMLLVGSTYLVGPDMYSRLFCAKDSGTARRSVFLAVLFLIPIAFAITFIGMGASALFPGIAAEQAFPMVVKQILPPVVGGLVLAALVSAVMSSADTTLMSAGTILTVDILGRLGKPVEDKKLLTYSRWSILGIGVVSLALALLLKGVIAALLFAYSIYTAGVIIPVVAGFYKHKLKVTPLAALLAITGGGLVALVSKIWAIKYMDLVGLALCGIILFAVSFIQNRLQTRKTG